MINLLRLNLRQCGTILKTQSYRVLYNNFIPSVKNYLNQQWLKKSPGNTNFNTRFYSSDATINNDIILYKYENPKFYNMLNAFAICQFMFWNYLSHFAFTTLKDAPVDEDESENLKWYQRINLGDNKYRNGITVLCFIIGYGILGAAWMFTLRSVRFLILRKGGQELSFVTYGPFNQNRIMTVPLSNVSAQQARNMARVQLPLKVKNRSLYYVLDMRGEFRNPKLFDSTAGLRRRVY